MRVYVVKHLGGNKAEWECPQGHRWTMPLVPARGSKRTGPGRGGPKRVATPPGKICEDGYRLLASWWSKEKGGVQAECPKCEKELARREASARNAEPAEDGECRSCRGYGYFDEHDLPTIDKRCRKCSDCGGSGLSKRGLDLRAKGPVW